MLGISPKSGNPVIKCICPRWRNIPASSIPLAISSRIINLELVLQEVISTQGNDCTDEADDDCLVEESLAQQMDPDS